MPRDARPILGITMGDPAGVGPEVIAKALADRSLPRFCRPLVIGSLPVMERAIRMLRLNLWVRSLEGHDDQLGGHKDVVVLDPLEHPMGDFEVGAIGVATGAASVEFIKKGVALAQAGCVHAIVTGPISKEAINLAGHRYPGHTEMLADLTGTKEVGMMLVGGRLRVMLVTTHVAIRQLPDALTVEKIERAIRLAHRALHDDFGIRQPNIGVAALNPHAGEGGLFGDEEGKQIIPATRRARELGIAVTGPLPADTLFGKAVRGQFDGVVAMFHDQGLIALKLIAFGKCVNLTVGLPIIRTSVDHGTAYDIAGKGLADHGSLMAALKLAAWLVRRKSAQPVSPAKKKRRSAA